jgi:hypothetical protein
MGGSATLGDNLVDDLVPTVDELRSDLYVSMGVSEWNVHLVKRAWSGPRVNDGVATIVSDVTMDPPPLFEDGDKWQRMPHGLDNQGRSRLLEVSLTYTDAELTGGTLQRNEEFYYRLVDARGQGRATQYYRPAGSPVVDRNKSIGWIVLLERAEIAE